MSKHTEGRIEGRFDNPLRSESIVNIHSVDAPNTFGDSIATIYGAFPETTRRANAERFVATWNALEGVPTEDIEGLVKRGKTAPELLEALELMYEQFMRDDWGHDKYGELPKDPEARQKAREAIAKAKGEG